MSWTADDEGIFLWDVDIAPGPGAENAHEDWGLPAASGYLPDLDLAPLFSPHVSSHAFMVGADGQPHCLSRAH